MVLYTAFVLFFFYDWTVYNLLFFVCFFVFFLMVFIIVVLWILWHASLQRRLSKCHCMCFSWMQ